MAKEVCVYFQVHQPNRLKKYTFFDIGNDHFYEDDHLNKEILFKVSEKCYLPANDMLFKQIEKYDGKLKIAYSLSGTLIEQFEHCHPRVLNSFRRLANTGCVEFLAETYYHSLAFVFSEEEFIYQVKKHQEKIEEYFGVTPQVFRNTELIYNNALAKYLDTQGYKAILTEGIETKLKGRTPNQVYKAPDTSRVKLLLRNYELSDDIAFRFSDKNWSGYPLTGEKFSEKVLAESGNCVNLFMDYESIGEHQWSDSGIFEFWPEFFEKFIKKGGVFKTPSEAIRRRVAREEYNTKHFISWADNERDLSAWRGNTMQKEALEKVYGLQKYLKKSKNDDLWHIWRKLQTSDHFYYLSTKHENDGDVHQYFSPYNSPYDAYIYFMNALADLEISLEKEGIEINNRKHKS